MLDCGCGGGANIKTLLKLCPNGKVQGIDYSAVSVEKNAKRSMPEPLRQDGVPCNRQVWQNCRLKRSSFDVVTAFETVYFWPELAQNFRGGLSGAEAPAGVFFFICKRKQNGEKRQKRRQNGRKIINGIPSIRILH